ncbi:hypothetical protein CGJ69_24265, partial [Vibrio parahaemolyticus]
MVNLLMGKFATDESSKQSGWLYSSVELKERMLRNVERLVPWEPVIVSDVVNSVITQIGWLG